jgi:ACS family hexuronate transporter-like MFS transporter
MTIAFGWRACFWITAASGFLWLALWLIFYQRPRRHRRVSKEELAYIESDHQGAEKEPSIGWLQALGYRETWGFAGAKFFSDPVWWFYLFWLPPYLYDARQFDMTQVAWALPVIYLAADAGSVGGGWISGFLIRRGWPNGKARKTALAICAFCMPVAATAVLAESTILAVALISLATAAHQGWSANLFTTTSDVFPNNAVGSVVGIGGAVGGFGGILFSGVIPGYIVTYFGYGPMFVIMGSFHLIGLLIAHLLLGDMRPIRQPEIVEA